MRAREHVATDLHAVGFVSIGSHSIVSGLTMKGLNKTMNRCYALLLMSIFLLVACSHEEPNVITLTPVNIEANSAVGRGEVYSASNNPIENRGLLVSTNNVPTLNNVVFSSGTGTGTFEIEMTGLESSTTYFVRAFATYSRGTVYGAVKTFSTTPSNVLIDHWDCESLDGVNSSYMQSTTSGSYESAPWGIVSGWDALNDVDYTCWGAPNPLGGWLGGGDTYVEFSLALENPGFFQFWTQNCKGGHPNAVPTMYINGGLAPPLIAVEGSNVSCEWMKYRTAVISPGEHTVRLHYTGYHDLYRFDEFDFFELQ